MLLIVFFVFFLAVRPQPVFGQSQVDEYRLKAAFLFHFAQFVEWPRARSEDGLLVLCVLGEDPFNGDLEHTVEGKSVAGRSVQIRYIQQVPESKECHLIFLNRSENRRLREVITTVANLPVLTVGETEDFLRQGGIIRFCMEDRKVRFEVNQEAAEKAHLSISARLLLLAKTVVGRSGR